MGKTAVWLDCDPGHDDAFAILLAAYSKEIDLLGVSIVHGNYTVVHCALNAKRFMWACGIRNIPVYQGIQRPFVRTAKHCPEIHGVPGEDGVAGMCGFHFPDEEIFSDPAFQVGEGHAVLKMNEVLSESPRKVTVIATGAQTNVAMLLRMFPAVHDHIEKIVFMGGAIGLGNTSVAAEFNIEIDPESCHVLLHSGIPLVMVPLEVTHTVLVTPAILDKIRKLGRIGSEASAKIIKTSPSDKAREDPHPHVEYEEIFRMVDPPIRNHSTSDSKSNDTWIPTPFANCCLELLTFFGTTYKSVFSFDSPPLHDPCAVFYVMNPEAFKTKDMFVDVEISSDKTLGRTLCDIHGILKQQPNVKVCVKMDTELFWNNMLECMEKANENSCFNTVNACK